MIGKINQTLIWNNMQWKSWLVNGTSEIVCQCDELYQRIFIKFLYNARGIKLFARCITNIFYDKKLIVGLFKKKYSFNLFNVNIIKELCNLERIIFKALELALRNVSNV